MEITSKDNPLVKEWRRLSSDPRARRESGRFAMEGARLCEDAARSGVTIEAMLYTARAAEQYADRLAAVRAVCGRAYEIPSSLAETLSDTRHPQGVFCLCAAPDNCRVVDPDIDGLADIRSGESWLALEDVRDPTNLGTIIRTAEAFGTAGLLLTVGCCDVYNPKVLRGSMGGVFRLPMRTVPSMAVAVAVLRQRGIRTWACVPSADAQPIHTADLGRGSVCLIGNEGDGLQSATIAACDGRLTIPMAGRAESLNASMAAGVVLWEMARQAV